METHDALQPRWVKQADLDVAEYDRCIESSGNSPVYATSWFLGIMAEEWDVLVYGDYRHVMPVPHRRKLGIAYVYQPVFAQQLGIFPPPCRLSGGSFTAPWLRASNIYSTRPVIP